MQPMGTSSIELRRQFDQGDRKFELTFNVPFLMHFQHHKSMQSNSSFKHIPDG